MVTIWLLLLPFSAASALLVHELAHCVVGVMLGLKLALIRLSVLEICLVQRERSDRPRASLERLLSGEVIFSPEGTGTRWKWAAMSLAGPVVSLAACFGLLLTGGFALRLIGGADFQSYVDIFRLEFVLLSGVLFLANAQPSADAFSPNDWFHFFTAVKGGEAWTRWEACLILLYQNWRGRHPGQWPQSALPRLTRPNDRTRTELRAYVLRIYMLGDRGDCNAIKEIIRSAASLAEAHGMYELLGEFAFWEIVAGCDTALAAATLKRAEEHTGYAKHPSILKARALLIKNTDANQESIRALALRVVEKEIANGRGGIGVAERERLLSYGSENALPLSQEHHSGK